MGATEQTHAAAPKHKRKDGETDREWAERIADERLALDTQRHEELRQINALTQKGTAKIGMDVEDMKSKIDAVFETVCGPEPTSAFGKAVHKMDSMVKKAMPYVAVSGAIVAVGYGGVKGVQGIRGALRKRAEKKAARALAT